LKLVRTGAGAAIRGLHFGDQCVIGAVGVDAQGNKHVLGIQEGATENAAEAKDLLQSLVERRRFVTVQVVRAAAGSEKARQFGGDGSVPRP
jgi:transposase-like protein